MDIEYQTVTEFETDRNLRGVGDELVTQTGLADEAGFDLITVGEPHFTRGQQYLSNEAILSHIAESSATYAS